MKKLIKPPMLKEGDKIATVSLSWGGAGDIRWRYEQGKRRLREVFGLDVVEMQNTLKESDFVYAHPDKRAEDLMNAFSDHTIKGIFCCIGGNDSIRMLPYINLDIIKENPKVFIGYSDSTIPHFMCFKAGLASFYGPAVMVDFAENVSMSEYTIYWIKKTLFSNEVIGSVPQSNEWTSEFLPWDYKNRNTQRKFTMNNGYHLIQGTGISRGRLFGGCMDTIENTKGTILFPDIEDFDDSILFLETSENKANPIFFEKWMRNYGTIGVLNRIKGLIFGKPVGETYMDEYKQRIIKVLAEYGRSDLPVLYNMSFGHCEPKCCIPYGVLAEINCNKTEFSILESSCI